MDATPSTRRVTVAQPLPQEHPRKVPTLAQLPLPEETRPPPPSTNHFHPSEQQPVAADETTKDPSPSSRHPRLDSRSLIQRYCDPPHPHPRADPEPPSQPNAPNRSPPTPTTDASAASQAPHTEPLESRGSQQVFLQPRLDPTPHQPATALGHPSKASLQPSSRLRHGTPNTPSQRSAESGSQKTSAAQNSPLHQTRPAPTPHPARKQHRNTTSAPTSGTLFAQPKFRHFHATLDVTPTHPRFAREKP